MSLEPLYIYNNSSVHISLRALSLLEIILMRTSLYIICLLAEHINLMCVLSESTCRNVMPWAGKPGLAQNSESFMI